MKLINTSLSGKKCIKRAGLIKGENGISLIEILIALAILGIIGAGFLSALGSSSKALYTTNELETAKNLAQSQMEYVKSEPFDNVSYVPAPIPSEYTGYVADISITPIPSRDDSVCSIQKISIIVSHNGKPIIMAGNSTLESFKVER